MSFIMICRNSHRNHHNNTRFTITCVPILQLILGTANTYVHSLVKINPWLPQEVIYSNIKERTVVLSKPHIFPHHISRGKLVFNPPSPNLNPHWMFLTAKKKIPEKMGGTLEGRHHRLSWNRTPPGSLNSRTPWWRRDAPDWSMGRSVWSGGWVTHRCWRVQL